MTKGKNRQKRVQVTDCHRFDLAKDTAQTLSFHGNESQLTTKYGNVFERAKLLKVKLWMFGHAYEEAATMIILLDERGNQGAPSGTSLDDWVINSDWPDPGQKKFLTMNRAGCPSVTLTPKGGPWFDIWESGYNYEDAIRIHCLWTTAHAGWTTVRVFYETTWLLEA